MISSPEAVFDTDEERSYFFIRLLFTRKCW